MFFKCETLAFLLGIRLPCLPSCGHWRRQQLISWQPRARPLSTVSLSVCMTAFPASGLWQHESLAPGGGKDTCLSPRLPLETVDFGHCKCAQWRPGDNCTARLSPHCLRLADSRIYVHEIAVFTSYRKEEIRMG